MEGVNNNDAATLSLLGGGGGGLFNRGQFADNSSNAVRINASERSNDKGQDFLSRQISDSADRSRDITGLIQDSVQFGRVNDRITSAEKAAAVSHNEIIREMNANARAADKCCCETQKLITAEGSSTRALILEVESRGTRDALATAQARINQLEIINALAKGNG